MQDDRASNNSFIEFIHNNFEVLSVEGSHHYHFWWGDTKRVIKIFKGTSFPNIETLAKMEKLPPNLLVMCSSDLDKGEYYGSSILKRNGNNSLELICFVVNPKFRIKKYGTQMLTKLDDLSKKRSVQKLSVRYRTYWKSNSIWEQMLDDTGWSAPELQMWYVSMPDANVQYGKEWLEKSTVEAPFYIEDWSETSFAQLEETLQREDWKGLVRKELNPFQLRKLLLPHVSFLLKREDEVTGWIVCHLLSEKVVQCSSLFVHPEKGRGQGLKMVAEAFKRRQLGARVIWSIEKHNQPMLTMTKKYIAGDKVDLFENRLRYKAISLD